MRRIPAGPARAARLVGGCAVVGLGVGLVLLGRLGSDGYSTAVYGISTASRLPYAVANWALGLALVLFARTRGVRPGVGTVVHPLVVGSTVDAVLTLGPPGALGVRVVLLVLGVAVLAAGVALYLGAGLGSGPFESAALALRPVPFRVAYGLAQVAGMLTGWALGAPVGAGTVLVVLAVGPLAHTFTRGRLFYSRMHG